MKDLNLNQFKNLKSVLRGKEQFLFTVTCHDSIGMSLHDSSYRLVNDEFKGIYEPIDFVSIDIFKDRVELHVKRECSRTHVSKFSEREMYNLYDMKKIDKLEFAIIKAVDKWNSYYYD
ncbi:hypothetical protein [Clostridium sp.]|uniref:hypothetical protein n=1 Tax=Clostridium sp. TaxID=1506 RepID=UPI001ED607B4|nr:hypothetical protein [Clostridium sp.]MBS5883857.1 hypothetical protein [Clostridium sp.]MDU7240576.1 hypothetical protein [Clostridium sp.]